MDCTSEVFTISKEEWLPLDCLKLCSCRSRSVRCKAQVILDDMTYIHHYFILFPFYL